MVPDMRGASRSWTPASYGRTCAGCSRAKVKCYHQSEGSTCQRCHRLGMTCEPSNGVRKRRAKASPQLSFAVHLEPKVDNPVDKRPTPHGSQMFSAPLTWNDGSKSHSEHNSPASPTSSHHPEDVLDTADGTVNLVRSIAPDSDVTNELLQMDVCGHGITNEVAQERLNTFKRSFLPVFPALSLDQYPDALDLRRQKPFTWFVIIAVASNQVSQQYSLGDAIWRVISERIIIQHRANLDLLLGLIVFGSWSHHFKRDKPFMTMLSQMAVTVALDLGLTRDTKARSITYRKRGSDDTEPKPPSETRTREDIRSALALFHLTCSTWMAYRKTEPLRWTPYLNMCLETLLETKSLQTRSGSEGILPSSELDFVLGTQAKCQLMTLQVDVLTSAHLSWGEQPQPPSDIIFKALLEDLTKLRENAPSNPVRTRFMDLYISFAEMMIRKSVITKPDPKIDTAPEKVKRLQRLEQLLESAEKWLNLLFNMPDNEMFGVNVDFCSQFMQTLVVLYRLNTHDEAGWSREEIRKRADVIQIIDHCSVRISRLSASVGVEGCLGPYKGLLSFTTDLLKAIRTLFSREIQSQAAADTDPEPFQVSDFEMTEQDINFSEEFLASVCEEPWFLDMFDAPWCDNSSGGPHSMYV